MDRDNIRYLDTRQDQMEGNLILDESKFNKKVTALLDHTVIHNDFVAKVVRKIMESLEGAIAISLESIATQLGLTARTLTLRLVSSSTSFTVLLDNIRKRIAVEEIIAGKKIEIIATNLQFKDQASFAIAFKRWSGWAPHDFMQLYKKCCICHQTKNY